MIFSYNYQCKRLEKSRNKQNSYANNEDDIPGNDQITWIRSEITDKILLPIPNSAH